MGQVKTVTKYVIGTKDKKLFRDDWGDIVDDIDFCVLSDSPTNLEMLLQDCYDSVNKKTASVIFYKKLSP